MRSFQPPALHPPPPRRSGNLVVVGDLMRSVSLLSYNAEQGALEPRAADYNSGWTTAVEVWWDEERGGR